MTDLAPPQASGPPSDDLLDEVRARRTNLKFTGLAQNFPSLPSSLTRNPY
jgi:hypothetical protein